MITEAPPQDTAILSRLFDVAPEDLSRELSQFLLKIEFGADDKDRMHVLSEKARNDELSEADQAEIDSYERVGHVLGILQAKARIRVKGGTSPD